MSAHCDPEPGLASRQRPAALCSNGACTREPPRCPTSRRESHRARWRSAPFVIGDCLFLLAIGAIATWIMHITHELDWGFVVCAALGMLAAMLVQAIAAWIIAPLLGSIESMVPSMVVAMVSPMSICGLHLLGAEPGHSWSLAQGAVSGLGIFLLVEVYGAACRRRFERYQSGTARAT